MSRKRVDMESIETTVDLVVLLLLFCSDEICSNFSLKIHFNSLLSEHTFNISRLMM